MSELTTTHRPAVNFEQALVVGAVLAVVALLLTGHPAIAVGLAAAFVAASCSVLVWQGRWRSLLGQLSKKLPDGDLQ